MLSALLGELDPSAGPPSPEGSVFADAVAAVGVTAAAARRRLGGVVGTWSPWQVAAAVCGGQLLSPVVRLASSNTSWPFAAPG